MKKLVVVAASAAVLGLSLGSAAIAAPKTGPYVLLGGGLSSIYKLKNVSFPVHNASIFETAWGTNYQRSLGMNYTGRIALGYLYNPNIRDHQAYGVELGYNYFSPINASMTNKIYIPNSSSFRSVHTKDQTKAWAADLEGVYVQDLVIPHTSLILKLGLGYESITDKITNTISPATPGTGIPASETVKKHGFGLAGGIGLQYALSQNLAIRTELDGMKGGKGIGYAQGIVGLVWSF